MTTRRRALQATLAGGVVVVAALLLWLGRGVTAGGAAAAPPDRAPVADAHRLLHHDPAALNRALARVAAVPVAPMPGARAVVVPHHWPAGHMIVGTLRDLAASRTVRRVVLLGPDHHKRGRTAGSTSDRRWPTPYGSLAADRAAVAALAGLGSVRVDHAVVEGDHGLAGLVPAVARLLGPVEIVPLAMRADAGAGEVAAMAAVVAALMDEATVIVLSVDLSHGRSPAEAARRDAETLAALQALDVDTVLAYDDGHMDAAGAAAVTLAVMRRVGAERWVVRERSDGSRLAGYGGGAVTGYVAGYFEPMPADG